MEEVLTAPPPTAAARPAPVDLDALFREAAGDLLAYVATLVGDRSLAEEVVAQAFERAWRRRALFRAHRGAPRAWLFGIARNAALDELRRRGRTAALAAPPPAGADHAEDVVRREALRAALARLEPRDRDLIALRFHGGLSHAEAGRVLGMSTTNAQTRLHRALTRLRELLDA
jgi:RNA polymerase sigma factor (sigma-70 family)